MDFSVLELHRMDGAESVALVQGPATLAYVQAAIDAGTIPDSCGFRLEECDCCDDVFTGYLWDSPAADGAPWYDAAQPASGEFLGMMLGDEEGLDTLGAGRTVTDNPVRGGIAGRTREGARTVTFKGTLFATTERGMEYGRRWLAWTLRSLDCAPCSESHSTIWAVRFLAWCEDACEAWRELVNVKLTAGPTFVPASDGAKSDRCTAYVQDVEFSLATTSPFLFGLPGCDEGCEVDLYEGEAGATFGATGATGTTRSLTLAATTETVAAGLWGGLPADYFDGTGDTGGETSAPGEWEDPLGYDDPGMVVIAYTITPAGSPAMQRVQRISATLDVEYLSSPNVGPWDVAMAFVDGDGNRLPGFQHGPTVDLPPSNAGAWRAIPGTAQQLVWTIVGDWSEAEVAAMRLTYLVRSRYVIVEPYPAGPTVLTRDHLTIDALDVLAQGYHGAGAPCACDWCRDWCRYPYACCSISPPMASDAVPIFTLDAPDGTDARIEVVQGVDVGGAGALGSLLDSFNRTDGAAGSTDGGTLGAAAWSMFPGGSATIDGNRLLVNVAASAAGFAWVESGQSDVLVEIDTASPMLAAAQGVLARFDDGTGNHFRYVRNADGSVEIIQSIGGQVSLWASAPGVASAGALLGLACSGSTLTAYVDGVEVSPGGGVAANPAVVGTKHGTYAATPAGDPVDVFFDAFSVTWETAGEPGDCDPASDVWRCSDEGCARFNVIGSGAMVVDGRLRLAFPHGAAQGDVARPLRWPDGCCGDLCVCAAARGRDDEPGPATLVVSWARRYTV